MNSPSWTKKYFLVSFQAKFGSTTASYFKFMREMLLLLFISTLFVLGLIFIPHILFEPKDPKGDQNSTEIIASKCKLLEKNISDTLFYPIDNASTCCSSYYEKLMDNASLSDDSSFIDYITPILTASDWMEYSYLFYGYYKGTFEFEFNNNVKFDFPLAYFLVIFSIFLLNLSVVVFSSASSIKARIERSIDSESGFIGMFPMVFGSWDHKIK